MIKMNLKKKAILIVAGILFTVIGINSVVITFLASHKYRKVILAKTASLGEGMVEKLNEISSAGVPVPSIVGVTKDLQQLVKSDDTIAFALVADAAGRIIFHNNDTERGKKLPDPSMIQGLSSSQRAVKETESYYNIYFPIVDANKQTAAVLIIGVKPHLVDELFLWILVISAASMLCSIGLVHLFISRFITEPILKVERVAERIASGNLDHEISLRGEDEIVKLGGAVSRISLNFRHMLSRIVKAGKDVSSVTEEVASSSRASLKMVDAQRSSIEEVAGAVNGIKNGISDVSTNTEALMRSAEKVSAFVAGMTSLVGKLAQRASEADGSAGDTSAAIEEMAANINGISESIEHLAVSYDAIYSSVTGLSAHVKEVELNSAESTRLAETVSRDAADSGLTAARASLEGMERIKETVGALTDTIKLLGGRSADIGRIVDLIDEIADRTHLLSLNSAILAAQAGEHGRPFEVVSAEMKDLAGKTSEATREIGGVIATVQEKIGESVKIAAKGMDTINEGGRLVAETDRALSAIKKSSERSTEMSKAIQRAAVEQTGAVVHVTKAMGNITEQFQYINKALREQSRANSHVVASMEKTKELSHMAMEAGENQREMIGEVTQIMREVAVQTGQIVKAIRDQQHMSAAIECAMEKVHDSAANVEKTARDLEGIVYLLRNESESLLSEVQKFTVTEELPAEVEERGIVAQPASCPT